MVSGNHQAATVLGLFSSLGTCFRMSKGVGTGTPLTQAASCSSGCRREKAQRASPCHLGSCQTTEAMLSSAKPLALGLRLRCGTRQEGGPQVRVRQALSDPKAKAAPWFSDGHYWV